MLEIFNILEPFFRDNYRRINVREYARIMNISPPSASSLLHNLHKESILNKENERRYIYFYSNREDAVFIALSRIYWSIQIKRTGLIDYLQKGLVNPLIILFGSFSKAEIKEDSDVDIAVLTISEKRINPINTAFLEAKLKHKIHIFNLPNSFRSNKDAKNKELISNIINGHILSGAW